MTMIVIKYCCIILSFKDLKTITIQTIHLPRYSDTNVTTDKTLKHAVKMQHMRKILKEIMVIEIYTHVNGVLEGLYIVNGLLKRLFFFYIEKKRYQVTFLNLIKRVLYSYAQLFAVQRAYGKRTQIYPQVGKSR